MTMNIFHFATFRESMISFCDVRDVRPLFSVWNARHLVTTTVVVNLLIKKEKKNYSTRRYVPNITLYSLYSYYSYYIEMQRRRNHTFVCFEVLATAWFERNDRLRVISLVLDISGRCYMLYYCLIYYTNNNNNHRESYQDPSFIGRNDHYSLLLL